MDHLKDSAKSAFLMGLLATLLAGGYSFFAIFLTRGSETPLIQTLFATLNLGTTVGWIAGLTGFACLSLPSIFYPLKLDKPITVREARFIWRVALALVLIAATICTMIHVVSKTPQSLALDVVVFYVPMAIAFLTPTLFLRYRLTQQTFLDEVVGQR